jgi:hypothetical protein
MTAISAKALCAAFSQAYDEHWGYIWGEAGDVWTRANQDAATREATVEYGSRWIGRRVADCSGLFVWAYKQHGEEIYHGSNTIFNDYTSKTGPLYGDVEIMPGTAVFQVSNGRRTHIGLYVGGGKVIEARGTRSGVIESDLSDWDEWGLLSAVDYSGVTDEVIVLDTVKTLRKGDSGLTVKWLQELLLAAGHELGKADGVFGSKTEAAVRAFQRDAGLVVDGIAGRLTLAALTALDGPQEESPEDDEPEETTETWERMTSSQREDWLLKAVRSLVDYVIELGHERVLQDGQLADRLIALTRGGESNGS